MEAAILGVLVCVIALILDRIFGEPRLHPLVAFGNAVIWFEKKFNRGNRQFNGFLSATVLVGIPVTGMFVLQGTVTSISSKFVIDLLVLTFVIGWQSMKEHAMAVYLPMKGDDLKSARKQLSLIVSRDTADLDERLVTSSVIESVLENSNDCLFASLFWYAILGPGGALMHRLVNTLDAMWGYKTQRYEQFGKFVARFDDCLGWIPARLTGICFALLGNTGNSLKAWKAQIGLSKSPNGGVVIASGAGALGFCISGPMKYNGVLEDKIIFGMGEPATSKDILRTVGVVNKAILVWLFGYSILSVLLSMTLNS
jgi:adenosylcobinamide-phosphate synthase